MQCNPFGGGHDPYVQDRHDLEDYNVPERVDTFVRRALAMAAVHQGELASQNIMWLMGSDFMYAGRLSPSRCTSSPHRH